jgi:dTDP-glucose 4,6-dehydratase
LIPLVTLNAIEGRELPVYGDGQNVRDWLYVEDHCEALAAVLAKGRPGESYNIGGNNERTNISLVEEICDLVDRMAAPLPSGMPRRSLIRFVKDRPGHDRRYAIDAGKIREEIGWTPRMEPKEGLELTVAWYLDHPEWVASVRDGSYKEYYARMYGGR